MFRTEYPPGPGPWVVGVGSHQSLEWWRGRCSGPPNGRHIHQPTLSPQPARVSLPHHHHHHRHGPSPLYVRCSMIICGVPEGSVKMVCRKRFPGFRGASSHLPQSATLLNSHREKATFLSNRYTGPGSVGQAAIKIDMHVPRPLSLEVSAIKPTRSGCPRRQRRQESKKAQRLDVIRPRNKEDQSKGYPADGDWPRGHGDPWRICVIFVHRYPKDCPLWGLKELILTVPWHRGMRGPVCPGSTFTATANIKK